MLVFPRIGQMRGSATTSNIINRCWIISIERAKRGFVTQAKPDGFEYLLRETCSVNASEPGNSTAAFAGKIAVPKEQTSQINRFPFDRWPCEITGSAEESAFRSINMV